MYVPFRQPIFCDNRGPSLYYPMHRRACRARSFAWSAPWSFKRGVFFLRNRNKTREFKQTIERAVVLRVRHECTINNAYAITTWFRADANTTIVINYYLNKYPYSTYCKGTRDEWYSTDSTSAMDLDICVVFILRKLYAYSYVFIYIYINIIGQWLRENNIL